MEKEKVNRVELDPRDNRSVYINGERVEGVYRFSIDVNEGVTISFPAEIGVLENFKNLKNPLRG